MGKQPAAGTKKTKEAIAKAANSKKGKKKKWGAGKMKEKLNNEVFIDKATYDKMIKSIQTMRIVSVSTVSERFKVIGTIARRIINHLVSEGLVNPFGVRSSKQFLYIGAKWTAKSKDADDGKKKKKKKQKQKQKKKEE